MIYFSHLLRDEDMKEIIETTDMGVESIEFSISDNLDRLDQTLFSYGKRLENINCRRLSLHGPFLDLNPAAFDSLAASATMTRYEQAYRAAKVLDADRLILHSCFVPQVYYLTGWSDRVADFYRRFLDDKDDSVQILMENVLDPCPGPLLEIAEKLNHPAFGFCPDLGHAHCYSKIPVRDWITALSPYTRHFHLHDNSGDRDSHLAMGDGTLPYGELFAQADFPREVSYTIECCNPEDVLKSFRFLCNILN